MSQITYREWLQKFEQCKNDTARSRILEEAFQVAAWNKVDRIDSFYNLLQALRVLFKEDEPIPGMRLGNQTVTRMSSKDPNFANNASAPKRPKEPDIQLLREDKDPSTLKKEVKIWCIVAPNNPHFKGLNQYWDGIKWTSHKELALKFMSERTAKKNAKGLKYPPSCLEPRVKEYFDE